MRENNRKPIERCRKRLSQFTTMNVIDGQAVQIKNFSLTFYSLTIDNILNIIVLLILAGISIGMLTGENGLVTKANEAKINTEIANEKEIVDVSAIQAMGNSRDGEIKEEEFNEALTSNIGKGKFVLKNAGEEYLVTFVESNRTYSVDNDGSADIVIADKNPGDYTEDGKLDGTEEKPYKINSIEDLIAFHNDGSKEADKYLNKKVLLMRNLNFKAKSSYANSEDTTTFGDYNGDGITEGIMKEVTKEDRLGLRFAKDFKGTFDGQNCTIKNMYINEPKENNESGRAYVGFIGDLNTTGSVKNLTVEGTIKFGYEGEHLEYCRVGGLIGRNTSGNVENCTSNVNIEVDIENTVTENTGTENTEEGTYNVKIGGLMGNNEGTVSRCKNYGKINVVYKTIAQKELTEVKPEIGIGGIAGKNESVVRNSINYGNIQHKGTKANEINLPVRQQIGGICGELLTESSAVENCVNLGNIITETEEGLNVGGIVGDARAKSTVNSANCYNEANIESTMNVIDANNQLKIAGIMGNNQTNIKDCYNRGEVNYVSTTGTTKYAGFIIGNVHSNVSHINCKYLVRPSSSVSGGAENKDEDKMGNPIERLTSFTREDALQLLNQNVEAHNSTSEDKWVKWKVQGNSIAYID